MKTMRCLTLIAALTAFFLDRARGLDSGEVNLALSGSATQSSEAWGGSAQLAIDGRTGGSFWDPDGLPAVTHTAVADPSPTWEVRLAQPSSICRIVLWNRTDCCSERLSNFRVSVLNDLQYEVFGQDEFSAGFGYPDTASQGYQITLPSAVLGRTVQVRLLGQNQADALILSLAEVEVFGAPAAPESFQCAAARSGETNIAPQGQAAQSSTFLQDTRFAASNAIDGQTDGDASRGFITHTDPGDADPWWQLELPDLSAISRIVLWNRTDCCRSRLSNFRVSVLDGSLETAGYDFFTNGGFPDPCLEVTLPRGTRGRSVRVGLLPQQFSDAKVLSLAEVQVFGKPALSSEIKNGDINGDGVRDISDAISFLSWLFLGSKAEPEPAKCASAPAGIANGDTNGDQKRDISDVVYLLAHLFAGGPEPVPICGSAESDESLDPRPSLILTGLSAGGRLLQSTLSADGSSEPFLDAQAPLENIGEIADLDLQQIGPQLHLLVVGGGGGLLHALRSGGSWSVLGDVESQAGDGGLFAKVAAAQLDGDLQVCALNREGQILHTTRSTADGVWQPFADAENGSRSHSFKNIACVGYSRGESKLQVLAVGREGGLFYGSRSSSGLWAPFKDVREEAGYLEGSLGLIDSVACAVIGSDLHLCALTREHQLVHTRRSLESSGPWTSFTDLEAQMGVHLESSRLSMGKAAGELYLSLASATGDLYSTKLGPRDLWSQPIPIARKLGTDDRFLIPRLGESVAGLNQVAKKEVLFYIEDVLVNDKVVPQDAIPVEYFPMTVRFVLVNYTDFPIKGQVSAREGFYNTQPTIAVPDIPPFVFVSEKSTFRGEFTAPAAKAERDSKVVLRFKNDDLENINQFSNAIETSQPVPIAARYTVIFDSIEITETRSVHEDTNTAALAVSLGNEVRSDKVFLGNENNGIYRVGLEIGPFDIVPGSPTPLVVAIGVWNQPYSPIVVAGFPKALEDFAQARIPIPDPAGPPKIGYVGIFVSWFAAFALGGCDGPVVVDRKEFVDHGLPEEGYIGPRENYTYGLVEGLCNLRGSNYFAVFGVRRLPSP